MFLSAFGICFGFTACSYGTSAVAMVMGKSEQVVSAIQQLLQQLTTVIIQSLSRQLRMMTVCHIGRGEQERHNSEPGHS